MLNYMLYEHRKAYPQCEGLLLWDFDNEENGWDSRLIDRGQATVKLYHLRLRVEYTLL